MRSIIIILLIFNFLSVDIYSQDIDISSQIAKQATDSTSFFYASIVDTQYGITIYESLNFRLGGDSIRHNIKGYASSGWVEDFYPNGKLLHRGYYMDGQLKIYKNYYPNGNLERSYRTLDNYRSSEETYYSDGTMKSKVLFHKGYPLKLEDYYPSGKLEYMEEFHKNLDYYIIRKSFYENGQLESSLELINPKNKIFFNQEYFKNRILKEEGKMVFISAIYDYQKIGKWLIYNETGKLIREESYDNGVLSKTKNY
ncbi:MAG: hypothetical protein ABII90_01145 [Bacteroidota bacterium]